jgi:hypothetical protein
MPNTEGILWFEDGMYQGGTKRGYDSINLYDQKTKVIAVFKKQSDGKLGLFISNCKLTAI